GARTFDLATGALAHALVGEAHPQADALEPGLECPQLERRGVGKAPAGALAQDGASQLVAQLGAQIPALGPQARDHVEAGPRPEAAQLWCDRGQRRIVA